MVDPIEEAGLRLERKVARRLRVARFWKSLPGRILSRVWWHVLHPTSWPERQPTKAEIEQLRIQCRNRWLRQGIAPWEITRK